MRLLAVTPIFCLLGVAFAWEGHGSKFSWTDTLDKRGGQGQPPAEGCKSCNEGFKLADTGVCVDIDECSPEEGTDGPCCDNQYCLNSIGSYTCNCVQGYKMQDDECVDVDECAENDACGANQVCVNTLGDFKCNCAKGFEDVSETDEILCQDVDECTRGLAECGLNEKCNNIDGDFECNCEVGFERKDGACVDINECLANPCHATEECENTVGHFKCVCPAGFEPADVGCIDIDECSGTDTPCGENEKCSNTHGSHKCTCMKGFEPDDDGRCVDINECDSEDACGPNTNCQNYIGTFECPCLYGFKPAEHGCVDIDECALGTHNCGENEECMNIPGHFKCNCVAGYKKNAEGVCEDINECSSLNPCGANEDCTNTPGSHECNCEPGYRRDEASGVCLDINECVEIPDICGHNAICKNTPSLFDCHCIKYHKRDRDGRCMAPCEEGFTKFGEICYRVSKEKTNFNDAMKLCTKESYLAQPKDAFQNEYLYNLLKGLDAPAWMGAKDLGGGRFLWIGHSGTYVGHGTKYTNWAPGQPDNKDRNIMHCMELHGPDSKRDVTWQAGQWNDAACTSLRYSVCQHATRV